MNILTLVQTRRTVDKISLIVGRTFSRTLFTTLEFLCCSPMEKILLDDSLIIDAFQKVSIDWCCCLLFPVIYLIYSSFRWFVTITVHWGAPIVIVVTSTISLSYTTSIAEFVPIFLIEPAWFFNDPRSNL